MWPFASSGLLNREGFTALTVLSSIELSHSNFSEKINIVFQKKWCHEIFNWTEQYLRLLAIFGNNLVIKINVSTWRLDFYEKQAGLSMATLEQLYDFPLKIWPPERTDLPLSLSFKCEANQTWISWDMAILWNSNIVD